jgi:hypothetical protein
VDIDTDVILLQDYLLESEPAAIDAEPAQPGHVELIWSISVCHLAPALLTTNVVLQECLYIHQDPFQSLRFQTFAPPFPSSVPRVFRHPMGNVRFSADDLAIMGNPSGRLNDICLNGIAKYLHVFFSDPSLPTSYHSRRCALYSTYDLLMMRYNATDEEIWRRMHKLEYWTKDVWILPIHRSRPAEHWVLCTISLPTRELCLFDSFAEASPWKHELPVRKPLFKPSLLTFLSTS